MSQLPCKGETQKSRARIKAELVQEREWCIAPKILGEY